jgi:Zn-dependent M28 family amino/carboxypeptidase
VYLMKYLSYKKEDASPGAMDNLSGIAQSISIVRYFLNHPHDYPQDCRILLCAFGSEEAGLRGSRRFAERHKHDLLAGDVWALNIDGVSDVEHFNLMKGEIMLNVNYNKDLVNIVTQSMREFGLYRPFWKLDVGASDAVTFCRMGKRAYTFAAQDNTPRNNYHTRYDLLENMNIDALRKMMILVLRVIEKISQYKQDYKPQWLEDYVVRSRRMFKKKKNIPNQ